MHRRAVGSSAKFTMGRKFDVPGGSSIGRVSYRCLGHASVSLQSVTGEADFPPSARRAGASCWRETSDGEAAIDKAVWRGAGKGEEGGVRLQAHFRGG